MSDPNPTNPTNPPTPAPKPRRPRGTSNREHTNELKDAKKVAKSARDPRYAPGLAAVELDPAHLTGIDTLVTQITADLAKMKGARTGRKTFTVQEKTAREALVAAIAPIQTAAKRQFAGDEETLRETYFIGEALASLTLEEVTLAGETILARLVPGENNALPLDTLPGITAPGAIKTLADALALYGAKDTAQGDAQSNASALLEKIEAAIDSLAALRRQVQLAADQAWPWRTKGVATIRKAFLLPTDRPLTE
jgi:hypothetical protein